MFREALRLLEERDEAKAAQLAEFNLAGFNEELSRRLDSRDRNQHFEPTAARIRLRRKSEAFRKSSGRE